MRLNFFKTFKLDWLILLLIVLNLIKLYKIDGGLVLGESDEWSYLEVARNFYNNPLPSYSGVPAYYSLPLYPFLAFLFSFLFPIKFLSLRLVSLLASIGLTIIVFFYLKNKTNKFTAFLASIIFIFSPLSVFYSRLGLIEMSLTFFVFSGLVLFESALDRKNKLLGFFSGILLGLGILSKYTALIFILVIIIYLLVKVVLNFNKKSLGIIQILLFHLLALALVTIPIVLTLIFYDRSNFKWQTLQTLNRNNRPDTFFLLDYLKNSFEFFTPLVVFFIFIGVLSLLQRKLRGFELIFLSLIFLLYFIFKQNITPRYLVVILPFISIFAGYGAYIAFQFIKSRLKIRPFILQISFIFIVVFSMFQSSLKALNSSYHTFVEDVGRFVGTINKDDRWILTNYWPSIYIDETRSYKTTWLSGDLADSKAFSTFPKSKYAKIDEPSFEILNKEGAIVILEDFFSKNITADKRKEAEFFIRNNFQPLKIFEDKNPNWPFKFNGEVNRIYVYYIPAKK